VAGKGFISILEGGGDSYYDIVVIFKGTVSHDFLLQIFKNHEDILSSRCTSGIKDNGGNMATGVIDTCG
jgi:hypothetical protein